MRLWGEGRSPLSPEPADAGEQREGGNNDCRHVDVSSEDVRMTQNLRLLICLGRQRTLSTTRCQTKIMTLAWNRITFAYPQRTGGLVKRVFMSAQRAKSNGPSSSTHHHLNILYVRDR